MSKYLSCAETAKLVRAALKEAFADVKFSVKSNVYSGGASINISYIDGPNVKQVEAVSSVFSGAYFDGMIDYKGSTYALVDGEQVRFGADFIFVRREFSDAFIAKCVDSVFRQYAGNLRGIAKPSAAEFRSGNVSFERIDGLGNYNLRDLIYQDAAKRSDRLQGNQSQTAAKVVYLGNDGYSDVGRVNFQGAA